MYLVLVFIALQLWAGQGERDFLNISGDFPEIFGVMREKSPSHGKSERGLHGNGSAKDWE